MIHLKERWDVVAVADNAGGWYTSGMGTKLVTKQVRTYKERSRQNSPGALDGAPWRRQSEKPDGLYKQWQIESAVAGTCAEPLIHDEYVP